MTATDIPRPRFARMYLRSAASAEKRGASDHRRRLLEGLSGTVVEIGVGHGLNFALYTPEVTEVVAIEPEPTLRRQAETAAARADVRSGCLRGSWTSCRSRTRALTLRWRAWCSAQCRISNGPSPKFAGCCASR